MQLASDGLTRFLTGILVPVSALRSDENLGAGEFADIPALSRWCACAGVDLIQLLPVNDSGDQSSPYSALSAFALHPLYLRITDLPELERLSPEDRSSVLADLAEIRTQHAGNDRIRYRELLSAKLALISRIFSMRDPDEDVRSKMEQFSGGNRWIRNYAAFKVLKAQHQGRGWREWSEFRDPEPVDIDRIWADENRRTTLEFHVWLQMRLEEQFTDAVRRSEAEGVALKGDLPILMNEDSADVWALRDLFITHLRAGAPPDMFSHLGQNWDLPIYDWDRMAQTGYQWWKDRLVQAAKFYSAYRIDHVLGFFRVWAIASENTSGLLGHFHPSSTATTELLRRAGLDDGRIRWLAEPHLSGAEVRDSLGAESDAVISHALEQIGDEDLYVFKASVGGERGIRALPISESAREWLLGRYTDRTLLDLGDERYAPAWNFRDCSRYQQLLDHEKQSFERLVQELGEESERIWEEQARRLLAFMSGATGMLACAEDLGVIPNAVPRVLGDLGMLGLRIPRWAREWGEPGQPYIPPAEYPLLTVCAPSVHDTSTMRGWWSEESDLQPFWTCLGLEGRAPAEYDSRTARRVIPAILETGSAICVLQIQDVLALSEQYLAPAHEAERVNVPGTVNDFNWTYRMPVTVEELASGVELLDVFRPMVEARKSRAT